MYQHHWDVCKHYKRLQCLCLIRHLIIKKKRNSFNLCLYNFILILYGWFFFRYLFRRVIPYLLKRLCVIFVWYTVCEKIIICVELTPSIFKWWGCLKKRVHTPKSTAYTKSTEPRISVGWQPSCSRNTCTYYSHLVIILFNSNSYFSYLFTILLSHNIPNQLFLLHFNIRFYLCLS